MSTDTTDTTDSTALGGSTTAAAAAETSLDVTPKKNDSAFATLMGSLWLVFLMFPIVDLWTGDRPIPVRVFGLSLIAVFIVLYVSSFMKFSRPEVEWRRL